MADQWASISELTTRYDTRTLGGLVSDDDTAETSLTSNAVLSAVLEDATAEVKSAVHQGQQYTVEQMAVLAASSNRLLVRLVCDLAVGHLFARRSRSVPDIVQQRVDAAQDKLDELRRGLAVFDGVQNADAQTNEPYTIPESAGPEATPLSGSALYPARATGVSG